MQKILKARFWTNLFFLIPLLISINYNLFWYAGIISVVIIVSSVFHFFNQNKYLNYLDIFFSNILILANLILLFMGHWLFPYGIITIVFTLIAIFLYFNQSKNYNLYHSFWHIFSASICCLSLVTYLVFLVR